MDHKPVRVTGAVVRRPVRKGTGSEHVALVITTDGGEELILQKVGANPFTNPDAPRLDGHRVSVEGFTLGKVLRYSGEAAVVDDGDDHRPPKAE